MLIEDVLQLERELHYDQVENGGELAAEGSEVVMYLKTLSPLPEIRTCFAASSLPTMTTISLG